MTTSDSSVGDGLVVVDKPSGWTSHDVVARMRRLAGTRKVGHAGTLDPLATGVLILGVNRATRLLGHLAAADKEYEATIRLGQSTVTDDSEGEVTASARAEVSESDLTAGVQSLTGDIMQVPSAVSAIQVDGVRSYARVRSGEQVALKARPVTVSQFDVLSSRLHDGVTDVDVRVVCSSGTYIRALARDLGQHLGVGGHLTALRRTRVGGYNLARAHTLEQLEARLEIVGLDVAVRGSFDIVELSQPQTDAVRFGRSLADLAIPDDRPTGVFSPTGEFLALYQGEGSRARPIAVFV